MRIKRVYPNICFIIFVPIITNTTYLDLHGHFVCMIIIQSEISSIAVESLEIPQIEVQIEQIDARDADNNREENVQDPGDAHHRISLISDTDYNASAESNTSSRRSSVDVPQFELCSHRNHRRTDNCDGDDRSEVGRL